MKVLLILAATLVGAAYAGVGTLSPQEEEQVLQMFQQICASGSEATTIGNTIVYCKRGRGDFQSTLNHQVNVQDSRPPPGQVVFVQPPPVKYVHRVQITGSGGQGQQAKIYVLPQQAKHELTTQYQGGSQQAVKPVVYFLKGDSSGGSSGGSNGGYPSGGSSGHQSGTSSGTYQLPLTSGFN